MTHAAAPAPATAGSNARRLVIGVALFLSALVISFVVMFPLGIAFDYPNHLAQYHIEANFRDPTINENYDIQLRLVPNLAADLLVVPLSSTVGVYTAGAIAITLAILVLPLSGVWLKYLMENRKISWMSLFMFTPIFNFSLFYGFLNYSLASGFAILFFALWIAMRLHIKASYILFSAMSVFLFFAHVLGLFLLIYMVVLYELGSAVTRGGINWSTLTYVFWRCAPIFPGLILLILLFAFSDGANLERHFIMKWPLGSLLSPFANPNHLFFEDYFYTFFPIISLVIFAVFFLVSMRERLIYVERENVFLLFGMFALASLMPHRMMGISFLDMRFAAPFIIIFVACVKISHHGFVYKCTGIIVAIIITSIQFANAFLAMRTAHEQAQEAKELFQLLPLGTKLLSVVSSDPAAQPYGHFYGYAVVERGVFAPNIFTNTSVIVIAKEQQHLSFDAWLMDEKDLAVAVNRKSPTPGSISSPTYFFGWEANFDYVFYVRGQDGKPLSYSCLAPIREDHRFALYEVKKPDAGDPCRQL